MLCWFAPGSEAQNSIGVQVGYLGTYTRVAEYPRTGRSDHDYLLDSMSLKKFVSSFQVAVTTNIGLGKGLYLSPGFHYSKKGLARVDFTDSTGYTWTTPARQNYIGISMLIGYDLKIKNSRYAVQFATGPQADFAVGMPNGGALFSGPYYRFFMPFSRFNEVDFTWRIEAGVTWKLGPGDLRLQLAYLQGLGDVLEDPFVIGHSVSGGISLGYILRLSK